MPNNITIGDMQGFTRANGVDLTDGGRCTGCGECCSNLLPMTEKEVSTIHKYITAHGVKEQHPNGFAVLASPTLDMTCPFLDPNKQSARCLIYSVRPGICRAFKCCYTPFEMAKENLSLFRDEHRVVNLRVEFFGTGV